MSRPKNRSTNPARRLDETVQSLIRNHGITYEALTRADKDVVACVTQRVKSYNHSNFVCALADTVDTHLQISVLGDALCNEGVSLGVALERLAVEAIIVRMREVLDLVPTYEHDCPNCAYLGHMQRQSSPRMGDVLPEVTSPFVDLYVCSKHVAGPELNFGIELIVRFGVNEFWFIRSQAGSRAAEPHLDEAARRAAVRLGAI